VTIKTVSAAVQCDVTSRKEWKVNKKFKTLIKLTQHDVISYPAMHLALIMSDLE